MYIKKSNQVIFILSFIASFLFFYPVKAQSPFIIYLNSGYGKIIINGYQNYHPSTYSNYYNGNLATLFSGEVEYKLNSKNSLLASFPLVLNHSNIYLTNLGGEILPPEYKNQNIYSTYLDFKELRFHFGYKYSFNYKLPLFLKLQLGLYKTIINSQTKFKNTITDQYYEYSNKKVADGLGVDLGFGIQPKITENFILGSEIFFRFAEKDILRRGGGSTIYEFASFYIITKIGWQF